MTRSEGKKQAILEVLKEAVLDEKLTHDNVLRLLSAATGVEEKVVLEMILQKLADTEAFETGIELEELVLNEVETLECAGKKEEAEMIWELLEPLREVLLVPVFGEVEVQVLRPEYHPDSVVEYTTTGVVDFEVDDTLVDFKEVSKILEKNENGLK